MVANQAWDRGTPKTLKLPPRPTHGMNIRPCEKIAKKLNCEIWQNGGHSHLRHPVLEKDVVYDHHSRIECPRSLTQAVMKVWDAAKEWLDRLEAVTGAAVAKPKPATRKATAAKPAATAGKKIGRK